MMNSIQWRDISLKSGAVMQCTQYTLEGSGAFFSHKQQVLCTYTTYLTANKHTTIQHTMTTYKIDKYIQHTMKVN